MDYQQQIIEYLLADKLRMQCMKLVQQLQLPDWLIAAGFVRNCIWDQLYGKQTPLNDVDVIYFDSSSLSFDSSSLAEQQSPPVERDHALEQQLHQLMPKVNWSVKNQARMHLKNGDPAYTSSLNAMSYWPEKQTCIGAKLTTESEIILSHCFDLALQFNGEIEHNPKRTPEQFHQRLAAKAWPSIWPQLKIRQAK